MSFKEKLKEIRKEKSITQNQLSEKSNIPISNIKKYEIGARQPGIDNLMKISKALEVPIIPLACTIEKYREFIEMIKSELKN